MGINFIFKLMSPISNYFLSKQTKNLWISRIFDVLISKVSNMIILILFSPKTWPYKASLEFYFLDLFSIIVLNILRVDKITFITNVFISCLNFQKELCTSKIDRQQVFFQIKHWAGCQYKSRYINSTVSILDSKEFTKKNESHNAKADFLSNLQPESIKFNPIKCLKHTSISNSINFTNKMVNLPFSLDDIKVLRNKCSTYEEKYIEHKQCVFHTGCPTTKPHSSVFHLSKE